MNVSTKTFLIFWLSSVLLTSCATSIPDPWIGLETETESAATPLDCGSFPMPTESSETGVVYDKSGLNDLNAYRQCSEVNEAIASEHAKQIDQLKISRKGLTEAGQAQRRIADMKQTMLNDERRHNLYMKFGLYAVIIAMGFAL